MGILGKGVWSLENCDRVPVSFWDWEGNISHALTMPQLRVRVRARARALGKLIRGSIILFYYFFVG